MDQLYKVELLSSPDLAPLYSLESEIINQSQGGPYSAIHQELTMRGGYEHSQRDLCMNYSKPNDICFLWRKLWGQPH